MRETAHLQSSHYLDCIIEEPLHGYDRPNKGDPSRQAFHSLKK
jgi:hypothetical protein